MRTRCARSTHMWVGVRCLVHMVREFTFVVTMYSYGLWYFRSFYAKSDIVSTYIHTIWYKLHGLGVVVSVCLCLYVTRRAALCFRVRCVRAPSQCGSVVNLIFQYKTNWRTSSPNHIKSVVHETRREHATLCRFSYQIAPFSNTQQHTFLSSTITLQPAPTTTAAHNQHRLRSAADSRKHIQVFCAVSISHVATPVNNINLKVSQQLVSICIRIKNRDRPTNRLL